MVGLTNRSLSIAAIALATAGCATVFRGTNDEIEVTTEPPGAMVSTTLETPKSERDRRWGRAAAPVYAGCASTPCSFKAPRRSRFLLKIEKEGFEPVEIGVTGKLGKAALTANLAATAGASAASSAALSGLVSGVTAGLATGAGAGAAVGATTAGVGVAFIGVDAATGAYLSLNPNPIHIVLPPEGTRFDPHPEALIIREELEKNNALVWGAAAAQAEEAAPAD